MIKGRYILLCMLFASCASKEIHTSIDALQKQNQSLRAEVAKLQSQVATLANDMLVVQSSVENAPKIAVQQPAPVPAPQKSKVSAKSPMGSAFFEDDIQFTDEEPSLKFTNKDLPKGFAAPAPSKSATSKSEFTEQTLVQDASSATYNSPKETGIEDPVIVASYNKAYKKFKEKNYRDTIQLMSDFLKQFPAHPYADNATFWIGESHFQLQEYQKANTDFEKVIQQYPEGNKVPDALLRVGICQLKMSRPEKAKNSFDQLIKRYPESVAAKRAMTTLGEL